MTEEKFLLRYVLYTLPFMDVVEEPLSSLFKRGMHLKLPKFEHM